MARRRRCRHYHLSGRTVEGAPPLIQDFLHFSQPYIDRYGYAAIFVAVLVEGFGIPAPGQTLLIASAVLAARGKMSMLLVAVVAYVAAVAGDNIGYAIGRFGGRSLVLRHGRFVGLREHHLDRVGNFYEHWGSGVVVIARFIDVLRQADGIAAGLGKLRWRRFAILDAIGCALWVGIWGTIAYEFGQHLDRIVDGAKQHPLYLIGGGAVIALAIAGAVVYRFRERLFGNDE